MKKLAFVFILSIFTGTFNLVQSQERGVSTIDSLDKSFLNWYNLDPKNDKVQGAAVERAYEEILQHKTPHKKIIVAVLDGGVDIEHLELRGKIWTNPGEIPGNGLDDDTNGYIDDIHGWNFIGNANGENINYENLEYVRIFKKLDSRYKDLSSLDGLNKSGQEEYRLYQTCKKQYEDKWNEYQDMAKSLEAIETNWNASEAVIKTYLNKASFTEEDLKQIKTDTENIKIAREYLIRLDKYGFSRKMLDEMKKDNSGYLDYRLNTAYNPRTIVSDNPEDVNDKQYGNNNIKGPSSEHGTFVAGIIAAQRNNNLGINGIADNVEIMPIRVVPDGDERDKDVALAIRYAVDNGAQVLNMSFGKDYSPQKAFVDEALKYASEHNVLLVHAAGNEAENLDEQDRYPTNNLDEGTIVKNWLAVGAITKKLSKDFCAEFSNYGQTRVDLFAPGVDIISLFPENTYEQKDGTSFSCPVVSGVAALVWSYYPQLTALELKEILLNSTVRYPRAIVYFPTEEGQRNKTRFSSLSITGGIINAYGACVAAEKYMQLKDKATVTTIPN